MHQQTYGAVVTTHRVVRSFLQRLEETESDDALVEQLPWITAVLPAHFDHEETADGFFDTVVRWLPDGEDRVRALVDAHQAMLHEIGVLSSLADSGSPELGARVRRFARRLAEHEAEEAQLARRCERARAEAGDLES